MNPNNQGLPSNPKIQSFLEALRASQSKQSSAENGPSKLNPNAFAEFQAKKEIEKKRSEEFFRTRTQEWKGAYSAKKREESQRTEQLKEEIKRLIDQSKLQSKKLDANLVKAVNSPVVENGVGQQNFLIHIKEMVVTYLLDVTSANNWLNTYNNRSRKQGIYHQQAKKGGSSYTQSGERVIATSVG